MLKQNITTVSPSEKTLKINHVNYNDDDIINSISDSNNNQINHISKQRYTDIILECIENASGHGLSRLVKKYHISIKLTWLFFLLLSYSFWCFYLIISTLILFFEFNVQSNIEIVSESPMDFPAIDICNLSPYDYDKLIDLYNDWFKNIH